jgi:hypothetical protein
VSHTRIAPEPMTEVLQLISNPVGGLVNIDVRIHERKGTAMLDRLFGKPKPPRDINRLIHDIADHHRASDHDELFRRIPGLQFFFSLSEWSDSESKPREISNQSENRES